MLKKGDLDLGLVYKFFTALDRQPSSGVRISMSRLRSELYQRLAEAMAEPPFWLMLPGRDWPLFEAGQALATPALPLRQALKAVAAIDAEPLEMRRARYTQVCTGPGRNSIGMYESGALNGKLLAAETFAVERWYHQVGLTITGAENPDHVSLELAFLSYVSAQASDDQTEIEAAFLQQHAGRWLPSLGRSIAASGDPVYAPIGHLMTAFLEEVGCQLGVPGFVPEKKIRPSQRKGHQPYMVKPEACTLCSFCVPACPTDALSIHENDHTTCLILSVNHCIGCGKCARACLTRAMAVGDKPPAVLWAGGGKYLLHTSERAACTACGAPMISQAEMAYIADRLDHPTWLAYCPDCRMRLFT